MKISCLEIFFWEHSFLTGPMYQIKIIVCVYVCVCVCVCVCVQSCPTLCYPMDCSLQAPLSIEFPRLECWSGLPFPSPGDLPDPGIEPAFSALIGRLFTTSIKKKIVLRVMSWVHDHLGRGGVWRHQVYSFNKTHWLNFRENSPRWGSKIKEKNFSTASVQFLAFYFICCSSWFPY